MASSDFNLLGAVRIRTIFDAVQDQRQVPGTFMFRNRTTKVQALDNEMIARFLGQAHIADIVADDQKASTYEAARIKFEETMIPNVKLGRTITQEDVKRIQYIANNPATDNQSEQYKAYFTREAENLMLGIEMREESMLVGMEIDSFTYNRAGVILTINWGMPAELKLTAANAWSDATNGTPIADILNQRLIAETKYNKSYRRVKMSTPSFRLLTKTNEFASQIKNFFINASQPVPSIPYQNINALRNLVGTILNMEVELQDKRYPTHPTDGSAVTYTPYQPLNKVILDDPNDDNNTAAKDLASGYVTEKALAEMGPVNLIGGISGGDGIKPASYMTVTPDLNPPTATFWAVERVMPRKKDIALTSVIDVGTVSDFISAGISF